MTQAHPSRKVQVWVYVKNPLRVLLLKTRPERGAFWQPVTGGVDPGEKLQDAALREAQEESGLPFAQPPRDIGFQFTYEKQGKQFEEHCFALEAETTLSVRLDSREHTDFQWVEPSTAAHILFHPSNIEGLERLLKIVDSSLQFDHHQTHSSGAFNATRKRR